ncbi:MAG: hypothetical protein ACXWIN_03790 [Burkholderiaceae bacterium]
MKNATETTRSINTDAAVKNDGKPRQPNDRDTTPDSQSLEPRPKIKQAYNDLEHGLVDTDMHGERGVEAVKKDMTLPHGGKNKGK